MLFRASLLSLSETKGRLNAITSFLINSSWPYIFSLSVSCIPPKLSSAFALSVITSDAVSFNEESLILKSCSIFAVRSLSVFVISSEVILSVSSMLLATGLLLPCDPLIASRLSIMVPPCFFWRFFAASISSKL